MPIPVLGRKPWLTSNAIRGGIVAIIAGVVGLSSGDLEQVIQTLTDLATILGGVLAIYGRVMATQKIQWSWRTRRN
jgi:hypothetical protein